ncbi:MAG: signal peptide peptidase SppA [Bacteroidaceae bacterium]|nr:signal peptide peptidase SppA [Bacteroidaceae bacterium]
MKDFLKFTLATVTGLVLAGGIFFVLSFILLIGIVAASSSKEVAQVKPNSILTIKLNKPIEERSIEDPFAMLMGEEYSNMGLNEILSSIKQAKENINIRGIYLEAGYYMDIPVAFLEEVRRALLDFKESGKFVVAYGDNYTQKEYYLCSVADKVMLNPQGSIEWTGLSESPIFFKRLLDKTGVEVQIFKVGTYKSAVEPFISTQMSEASREQTSVYLNSIWNRMNEDVAVSRDLTVKQLNEYADQMIAMEAAQTFIDAKLADTLSYKDGVKIYLKQLTDTALDKPLQTLGITEMANAAQTKMPITKGNNTIAVYYATGDITDNTMAAIPGETGGIDGNTVVKDLSRLREDANIKAVVLRVNSPGGSAFASEQIWNEVVKLKAEKPIIVSMGSMAASGGYYISCAADSIFAEATTLTGSIGIFGMVPNFEGLLTDKIGLDIDVVKTNPHSDMNFPIRPMSEREKNIIQKNVERGYALFVKRCADGRGMSEDAIRQVAEGRVWTGATAKELGLVDQLGGINEALKAASEKAGLEHYTVADYPEETDPFTALLQKGKDEYINARLRKNTGEFYHYLHVIQRLKQASPIQAHMGFYPNI